MLGVAGTTARSSARRPLANAVLVRFKSAAPAAATSGENVKSFKIYRWDPNVKVSMVQLQYPIFGIQRYDDTAVSSVVLYHVCDYTWNGFSQSAVTLSFAARQC